MSLRLLLIGALSLSTTIACTTDPPCEDNQRGQPLAEPAPQRNPYTGLCESFGGYGGGGGGSTCGDYQEEAPAQDPVPIPDWGICDGFCETLVESDCLAAEECRGSYRDTCAQDSACEPEFNQCWAVTPGGGFSTEACATFDAEECARHSECAAVHLWDGTTLGSFSFCADEPAGTTDPGSCVGEVSCDSLPPECPANTLPGRVDACWSGFCIPVGQCDALPSCASQSEEACIGRGDCQALYEGVNCDCTGEACVCESWLYESCQVAPAP